MNKLDVIDKLGMPDKIIPRSQMMRSAAWLCSTCGRVHRSDEPVPPPAPCTECKGIFFEKSI